MKALITRKLGMTTTLSDKGVATAVTLLTASPNTISQIKTAETDGYKAIQLCFEQAKKIAKPQTGHLKPAKTQSKILREFRINEGDELELTVGDQMSADIFSVGDVVDATGVVLPVPARSQNDTQRQRAGAIRVDQTRAHEDTRVHHSGRLGADADHVGRRAGLVVWSGI